MFDSWVGKIPRRGHGNPLQYSCLENPRGQRSLAGYGPWGGRKSDMPEQLTHADREVDEGHYKRKIIT